MSALAKAWVALGSMLLLGALMGAAGMRAYDQRAIRVLIDGPAELAPQRLAAFQLHRLLDLTPDQDAHLAAIFASHRPELEARRSQVMPWVMESRRRTEAEIRLILTPEQRARFDALAQKEDARIIQAPDAGY